MRRPASILWHSASVNGCDLRPHPTYVDVPFWCKQNFALHGPPQMAENAVRSARRAYGCYSAPKFDPLESRDLKRLTPRWASNRRAEQQPDIVVRIAGLADKRMMSGYSPWLKYDIWQPAKRRARPWLMFRGLQDRPRGPLFSSEPMPALTSGEADSRQGVADIPRGAPCGDKRAREARFKDATDGWANARLLERGGPAGPSDGAGWGARTGLL